MDDRAAFIWLLNKSCNNRLYSTGGLINHETHPIRTTRHSIWRSFELTGGVRRAGHNAYPQSLAVSTKLYQLLNKPWSRSSELFDRNEQQLHPQSQRFIPYLIRYVRCSGVAATIGRVNGNHFLHGEASTNNLEEFSHLLVCGYWT